jgi:hypothetical protein
VTAYWGARPGTAKLTTSSNSQVSILHNLNQPSNTGAD